MRHAPCPAPASDPLRPARHRCVDRLAAASCRGRACSIAAEPPRALPSAGIREVTSRHLTLVHRSCRPSAEIDALPGYFDQAFPQWCAYFGVDAAQHADWHVRGYLMRSRERFAAAGLLPADCARVRHRLFAGRRSSGCTTRRASTIAGTCCCTRGRTLHARRCWAARPALVRRGHGRAVGHASPGRRPAGAQRTFRSRATKCPSGAASRSCRPACRTRTR